LTTNWKQLAWNGIRFKIPADWEVGQIGARHLIFEDEAVPVMEIKWGVVKGTFSHRTHLKRLAALQSRRSKISVAEWILPPHWEESLINFKTGGFLWQSPEASARGAILFCAVCRTASLIQFFGDSSVEREKIILTVLKSFRDHSQDGWLLWSIFDIRATLPQSMQLVRFRFEAGKFFDLKPANLSLGLNPAGTTSTCTAGHRPLLFWAGGICMHFPERFQNLPKGTRNRRPLTIAKQLSGAYRPAAAGGERFFDLN
jgi:hypothetical protein